MAVAAVTLASLLFGATAASADDRSPEPARRAFDVLAPALDASAAQLASANARLTSIRSNLDGIGASLTAHADTIAGVRITATDRSIAAFLRNGDTAEQAGADLTATVDEKKGLDDIAAALRLVLAGLGPTNSAVADVAAQLADPAWAGTDLWTGAALGGRPAEVTSARAASRAAALELAQRTTALAQQVAGVLDDATALGGQLDEQAAASYGRLLDATRPKPAPRPAVARSTATSGRIVNVRGIWVDGSIADQLTAMIDAAAADGVSLMGDGYRDINEQIQKRRENCGTSDYAVYEMPADLCRVVTGRPGLSQHEKGLAIDFKAGGRYTITRGSAEFRWLSANAARFGFYNLPSEAWHWSTTGY